MTGSSVGGVQAWSTSGIELGEHVKSAWHWLTTAAASIVAAAGQGAGAAVRALLTAGESVAPRSLEAATWVKDQVASGIDYVEASANETARVVGDEIAGLREKTAAAVDWSLAAGLHRLGVPTQGEFDALSKRMDTIAASVARLKKDVGMVKPTRRRATTRPS